MLGVENKPARGANAPSRLLPLENGDFMHSREFLRRYEQMPEVKRAELIAGVVYMGSPVSIRHAKPDGMIQLWLGTYASRHPETEVLPNTTVILDPENTFQPDALLRRLPGHGGQTREDEKGYLVGPPELVVEVAASSASIDLRDKLRAYCRSGVREYLVWSVAERRLEWFFLEDDEYRAQTSDPQGLIESRVFPGLRLPVEAMLAGDAAKVLAAL